MFIRYLAARYHGEQERRFKKKQPLLTVIPGFSISELNLWNSRRKVWEVQEENKKKTHQEVVSQTSKKRKIRNSDETEDSDSEEESRDHLHPIPTVKLSRATSGSTNPKSHPYIGKKPVADSQVAGSSQSTNDSLDSDGKRARTARPGRNSSGLTSQSGIHTVRDVNERVSSVVSSFALVSDPTRKRVKLMIPNQNQSVQPEVAGTFRNWSTIVSATSSNGLLATNRDKKQKKALETPNNSSAPTKSLPGNTTKRDRIDSTTSSDSDEESGKEDSGQALKGTDDEINSLRQEVQMLREEMYFKHRSVTKNLNNVSRKLSELDDDMQGLNERMDHMEEEVAINLRQSVRDEVKRGVQGVQGEMSGIREALNVIMEGMQRGGMGAMKRG
ncbi:hypothetical protein ABKN59_010487 [Abortiporus biennis]